MVRMVIRICRHRDTETPRLREALEAKSVVDLSEFVAPAAGTVHGSCALCVSLSMRHWYVRVRQSSHVFRGKQPLEGLVLHDQHFDAKKVLGTWLCCVANSNRRRTSLECGNAELVLIWRIYPWHSVAT